MSYLNKVYAILLVLLLSANSCVHAMWYEGEKDPSHIIVRNHYASIPSTQLLAREKAEHIIAGETPFNSHQWQLITADEQTAAIWQHARTWFSPKDANIYATYILPWPEEKTQLLVYHLAQTVSLSIAETIESLGFFPQLQWVNDSLLSEKKMCEFLCESPGRAKNSTNLVVLIGIGLNVNMSEEQCGTLGQPVTSLKVESKQEWDKKTILPLMNKHLVKNLSTLLKHGFKPLFPEIQKRIAYMGKEITVEDKPYIYTGIFEGLNDQGAMLLSIDGKTKTLYNGDIIKKPS